MISSKTRLPRRDKMLPQVTPLRDTKAPHDPAVCTRCQAVWHKGVWALTPRRGLPPDAVPVLCPACRLIREGNPAGILYLSGSYFWQHRESILQCIRNSERNAVSKNPLERIIHTKPGAPKALVVETTSEKLARRLGRAIRRAHHGRLDIRFSNQDHLVRLYWHRDLEEAPAHG